MISLFSSVKVMLPSVAVMRMSPTSVVRTAGPFVTDAPARSMSR